MGYSRKYVHTPYRGVRISRLFCNHLTLEIQIFSHLEFGNPDFSVFSFIGNPDFLVIKRNFIYDYPIEGFGFPGRLFCFHLALEIQTIYIFPSWAWKSRLWSFQFSSEIQTSFVIKKNSGYDHPIEGFGFPDFFARVQTYYIFSSWA